MEREMRKIDHEFKIIMSDSKEWNTTPSDYLPGGLMSVFFSKCSSLIQQKNAKIGRLGNWIAIRLEHKGKRLEIINIYRIPRIFLNRVYCSLTQYNLIDRKIKSISDYRKELFEKIKKYVKESPKINDIIIARDYNQNIAEKRLDCSMLK